VQNGKELNDFRRNSLDIEILSNLRLGFLENRDTSVTRVTNNNEQLLTAAVVVTVVVLLLRRTPLIAIRHTSTHLLKTPLHRSTIQSSPTMTVLLRPPMVLGAVLKKPVVLVHLTCHS
jgi:hypothetical protein